MHLKIVSWNVLYTNERTAEEISFISKLLKKESYDVICLQEVSEQLLAALREIPNVYVTAGKDAELRHPDGTPLMTYHAIVSRIVSTSSNEYPALDIKVHRKNPYAPLLKLAGLWLFPAYSRGFISADFVFEGQPVRIFCVHPPLVSPKVRFEDFDLITKEFSPTAANIVCGDFNIVEKYPTKFLNFILGKAYLESSPWFDERKRFEQKFADCGLKNPLLGTNAKTQREAQSQLDHILIPKNALVDTKGVFPKQGSEFLGSDHYPIFVSFTL